jgi:hypothetical protein
MSAFGQAANPAGPEPEGCVGFRHKLPQIRVLGQSRASWPVLCGQRVAMRNGSSILPAPPFETRAGLKAGAAGEPVSNDEGGR